MAATTITYADKVTGNLVTAANMNEIKSSVNNHAGLIDAGATKVGAETLTNKRVVPRIYTTASIAGAPGSLTLDFTTYDYYEITAQAAALFFANPTTTTYTGGEKWVVVITCDATPRAITKDTKFVEKGGIVFPTTLVASKKTTFGFIYHKATDTINLIGLAQEA